MPRTSVPADWRIHRLAPALGAELTGPRLAELDDDGIAALHRLLVEH